MHPVTVGELADLRATRPAEPRTRRALRWLATPLRPFLVVWFRIAAWSAKSSPVATGGRCSARSRARAWRRSRSVRDSMLDPRFELRTAGTPRRVRPRRANAKPAELKTDREIDEAIAQRTAVARVKLGLGAVLGTPFRVLALGLAMLLLGRFIGGKPTMPRALTVAALASVPGAVRSLVTALAAWHQPRVVPGELDSLVRVPSVFRTGIPSSSACSPAWMSSPCGRSSSSRSGCALPRMSDGRRASSRSRSASCCFCS